MFVYSGSDHSQARNTTIRWWSARQRQAESEGHGSKSRRRGTNSYQQRPYLHHMRYLSWFTVIWKIRAVIIHWSLDNSMKLGVINGCTSLYSWVKMKMTTGWDYYCWLSFRQLGIFLFSPLPTRGVLSVFHMPTFLNHLSELFEWWVLLGASFLEWGCKIDGFNAISASFRCLVCYVGRNLC